MRRLRYRSIVAEADDRISIILILQRLGVEVESAPEPGSNIRVLCPFENFNHSGTMRDRRQMRIYSDNRAYCHECNCQYTPTSLMAMEWGCTRGRAAQQLLSALETSTEREELVSRMPVVRANVTAALAIWAEAHGVVRMSELYGRWMDHLDSAATEAEALEWLAAAKRSLSRS